MYFKQDERLSFFWKPPKQSTNEDNALWDSMISRYNEALQESEYNRALRAFLRSSLHRLKAGESVDLGYTLSQLTAHLESLFTEGMEWANYGLWEIDHILPIQWFIERELSDAKIVNSLTNLRPLWASENRAKGASIMLNGLTDVEFYQTLINL
ncbi:hypothetical protein FER63_23445 [Salmonella enterica]|nr:hypothetical protein [Salmonella enterica]